MNEGIRTLMLGQLVRLVLHPMTVEEKDSGVRKTVVGKIVNVYPSRKGEAPRYTVAFPPDGCPMNFTKSPIQLVETDLRDSDLWGSWQLAVSAGEDSNICQWCQRVKHTGGCLPQEVHSNEG